MTALQAQAVQMVLSMPDEQYIRKVIRFMETLPIPGEKSKNPTLKEYNEKLAIFQRLSLVWDKIQQYYPDGFDADREYEEAMKERGCLTEASS